MVYALGLNNREMGWYLDELVGTHTMRVRVQVLNLEHEPMSNISSSVMDGQVTVDWEGEEATRALSFSAFDPDYDLGFDTADVVDGAWFYDRMIQVTVEVPVPRMNEVVACPIFTGPVRKFNRTSDVVTIECVGKDIYARQSWPRQSFKKGAKKVDVIKSVLRNLGETKFRFEDTSNDKLAKAKTVDRSGLQSPWGYCRALASSMKMNLFYDGAGYVVLRKRDTTPVFTFRDGDGGTVLTEPESSGDYSRLANVVRAEGLVTGSGKNPYYEAMVGKDSPIHPTKLSRGGKPFYMGLVIQRDSIKSTANAKDVAKDTLADRGYAAYDVTFDSLPIFCLEEVDPIRMIASGTTFSAPLYRYAFGFSPNAVMPVGYKKLVAPSVAKIRKKK